MSIRLIWQSALLLLFVYGNYMQAQISEGGLPLGLVSDLPNLTTIEVKASDAATLMAEDDQLPGQRFAAAQSVDFSPNNSGQWQNLADGSQLWRIKFSVDQAFGLAVFYKDMHLAEGAKLFCYAPNGEEVRGAYTRDSYEVGKPFWTGFIPGEDIIVEYWVPANTPAHTPFRIWRLDHAFRPLVSQNKTFGFGCSKTCHPNANCPLGDDWENEKTSLARIIVVVEEGSGFCSGNLMNNTLGDQKAYLMTGFHCQDGFTPQYDMWRYDFGYRSQGCSNPADEPNFTSVLGSSFRAGRQENDFLLVELSSLANLIDPHFSGWDRRPSPPDTAVMLHHPRGDIMKINRSTSPITIITNPINWNNGVTTPADHHLRVNYTEGSFEIGSSGAAMYDENHRVVGHLHGGNAPVNGCDNTEGFIGRLYMAWEGGGTPETRLKDWLDPLNTGLDTLDAYVPDFNSSGIIYTENDETVTAVNVITQIGVDTFISMITNSSGIFPIAFPIDTDLNDVSFCFYRNDDPQNGMSVFDLIQVSKHILDVQPLDSPYKMIAADVNDSGSITTFDVIQMRKLILDIDTEFSNVPSWRFVPASAVLTAENVFDYPISDCYSFTDPNTGLIDNIDLVAIKMGDVNGSVTP